MNFLYLKSTHNLIYSCMYWIQCTAE